MKTRTLHGADGLRLAADEAGKPGGPVALLLHGGGQVRQSWGGALSALAAAGMHAFALDLRGHGESDWSTTGDYDLDAYVRDLNRVIAEIGEPVVLIGASLGGLTSLVAAGEASRDRVRALVLVDITTRPDPGGVNHIAAFMKSAPEGFASVDEAADAVARYMAHRPRPRDPSGLMRNLRERDGRLYWHWDPAFFSPNRRINTETERLESAACAVTAPTLLVWGLRSEVVTPEGIATFRTLMPNAEVFAVADAGHMVAGDKNDAFTSAVLAFVARRLDPPQNCG
ncbi:MAG: alpha/beta fold hydrolase [Caulobacterales bacterium]